MKNHVIGILITLSIIFTIMGFSLFNKETKEEKFWIWFIKNQATYYNEIENLEVREKIFDELSQNLNKVNDELVFEFSPKHESNIREFTVSADGIEELFPIVEKLMEKAPKLNNWKFNAFRQPIPGDDFEIQYSDFKIGYSDIFYKSANDQGKLGVELYIRDFNQKPQTKNAIYILLDGLIGEYNVTTKIGYIEWKNLNESDIKNLKPLIELRQEINK